MNKEVGLEILANIEIPPGFILGNNNDLITSITLEEGDLVTNTFIENCNCDEAGICTVIRNVAILTGKLNYNVSIGDLQPERPIDSVRSRTSTQFSTNGFIQVKKILAYSFNNDIVSTDYWIECIKGENFIINVNGGFVRQRSDPLSYSIILNNPNKSKIISVPYRIFIHSKNWNDD